MDLEAAYPLYDGPSHEPFAQHHGFEQPAPWSRLADGVQRSQSQSGASYDGAAQVSPSASVAVEHTGDFAMMDADGEVDAEGELEAELDMAVQRSAQPATFAVPNPVKNPSRNKRKVGQDLSRSSTPALPTEDSTTVAALPALEATMYNPAFFSTRHHVMNKQGFRYIPCGPSTSVHSKPNFPMYRVIESPPAGTVHFSWEDRSSYIALTRDAQAITTDKGFRAARANVPLREGNWYFEVVAENGCTPSGTDSGTGTTALPVNGAPAKAPGYAPHIRLGIGRREAHLNAPVGFDGYSYGIRDKTGDKVHLSLPKSYGQPFQKGDVIGIYVSLPLRCAIDRAPITLEDPERYEQDTADPRRIVRRRIPIRVRGHLFYESMEFAQSREMEGLAYKTKDPKGFERARLEAEEKKKKRNQAPPPGVKRKPPKYQEAPPPRDLPIIPGSKVAFFKNGECMGTAYEDLFDWLPLRHHSAPLPTNGHASANSTAAREHHHDDGSLGYYPFASVYGGAVARLNPGPDFAFPPPGDIDSLLGGLHPEAAVESQQGRQWRALSERYQEYCDETSHYDDLDEQHAYAEFVRNGCKYTTLHGKLLPVAQTPIARSTSPQPAEIAAPPPKPIGKKEKAGKANKKKTGLSKELLLEPAEPPAAYSPTPEIVKVEEGEFQQALPGMSIQDMLGDGPLGMQLDE